MIRVNFLLTVVVFASFALFIKVERSEAVFTQLPQSTDGHVTASPNFTDEVVALVNKNDGGDLSSCGQNDTLEPIEGMTAHFKTRTSGLVQVLFCGDLDNVDPTHQVDVIAMIDAPSANICQPGNIRWENGNAFGSASDAGGAYCFTWLCEVHNEKNCGRYGHDWCWTDHNIQMQCSIPTSGSDANFQSRILKVFYNKLFGSKADEIPDNLPVL